MEELPRKLAQLKVKIGFVIIVLFYIGCTNSNSTSSATQKNGDHEENDRLEIKQLVTPYNKNFDDEYFSKFILGFKNKLERNTKIVCSQNQLEKAAKEWRSIKYLDISCLESSENDDLNDLSIVSTFLELEGLIISYTDIDTVNIDFSKLVKLRSLAILLDSIKYIPIQINELKELESLYLSSRAENYEQLLFQYPKLKVLTISGFSSYDNSTTIDLSKAQLSNLEYLRISKTNLRITGNFDRLKNISTLSLSHTEKMEGFNINKLPNLKFVKLESLDFKKMKFDSNNREITQLSLLNFEGLPEGLSNLTKLRVLNLSSYRNSIINFSEGDLPNLLQINMIGDSYVREIPSSFKNLLNLKEINILGNKKLVHIDKTISQSPSLKFINLTGCDNYELSDYFKENKKVIIKEMPFENFKDLF